MIEFKLNEKENELAKKFMQDHRTIKCTICDAEENITDYNCW